MGWGGGIFMSPKMWRRQREEVAAWQKINVWRGGR